MDSGGEIVDTISTNTIKINDTTSFIVRRVVDECSYDIPHDFYGTLDDKPAEYCIDRRRGVLYGKAVEEPDQPVEDSPDEEFEEYDRAFTVWESNYGLQVLARFLETPFEHDQYRYFHPATDLTEVIRDVSPDWVLKTIQKYGSLEKWRAQQIIETWRRRERHFCGDLWFEGLVVTLQLTAKDLTIKLGEASLWGVESDVGEELLREEIISLITEIAYDLPGALSGLLEAISNVTLPSPDGLLEAMSDLEL